MRKNNCLLRHLVLIIKNKSKMRAEDAYFFETLKQSYKIKELLYKQIDILLSYNILKKSRV